MWKSRADKKLPPRFWSDFLAMVNAMYPQASFDEPTKLELYQLVWEEWQNGVQNHQIVKQICSCDKHRVVPSEAARQRLTRHRGIARPPTGAEPGEIFGLESLRDSTPISRLMARLAVAAVRLDRESKKKKVDNFLVMQLKRDHDKIATELAAARDAAFWATPTAARQAVPRKSAKDGRAAAAQELRQADDALQAVEQASELLLLAAVPDAEEEPALDEDIAAELMNSWAKTTK
jgi:hypothetical protein